MDFGNTSLGNGGGAGGIFRKFFHFPEQDYENSLYYLGELWPLFLGLVVAEYVTLGIKGKTPRLAESLNSLGHGILAESVKILTIGAQVSLYVAIDRKWRILDLPWDSPLTWFLGFLGIDLCYYFAHRATHDFNIAVSVRHPISHSWINTFFYLPLALVVPAPHTLAHHQLTLIYQAWLHTPLVGPLGPLEWILNTPTHHRVHHGCNRYVLDKNFGGFLIIWDRLFGTFQDFRPDQELVFGIVFQHRSFNPLWQSWHKFPEIWARMRRGKSWKDSLKVLLNGPSWISGVDAPRLGRDEDKVDVRPRAKFNVLLPLWVQGYLVVHFLAIAVIFQEFALNKGNLDQTSLPLTLAFFIFTLSTIGLLSEGNTWGPSLEILRCVLMLLLVPSRFQPTASLLVIPSALIWICVCARSGESVVATRK